MIPEAGHFTLNTHPDLIANVTVEAVGLSR
jgi:hypothetical protein